ncbi:cellulase family glycosylhydrolase [Candidatus Viridilinea mediisalina]|uniref:Uncharacterized protein n=1 Tax=Candidatus Viridilinea mediisalina TaxID=2024553 RepID=A0A2A6RNE1_9CHLR|nr:cellulase family glycosylhydrolase [Candidatus Viridilinea mediisalina]PDW04389.1 hypothetical protein CJ255_03750 [Candidatus Viridilinea mediisalina]
MRYLRSMSVVTLLLAFVVLTSSVLQARVPAQETAAQHTIFLPLVQAPAAVPLFGIETNLGRLSQSAVRARAAELGATWVRINGVLWHHVQPEAHGPYEWDVLARLDRDLAAAHAMGMIPTVIIRGAPSWAAVNPESFCSAVREDRFAEYAAFLEALAARYRDRVVYWELGNEPDVDPRLIAGDSPYGCWGNIDDPYYGGEHYGRMLQIAAPALRRGNPNAKIIFGGLLLNSPHTTNPERGRPELFLEGALQAGAARSFDVLGFHGYSLWSPDGHIDHDLSTGTPWDALGGRTLGKISFLQEIMRRHNLRQPLWLNEGGLVMNCSVDTNPNCSLDNFLPTQAEHLVRVIARTAGSNVGMYAWYTLHGPGWRDGALLDGTQTPRPSFIAYKHMIATTSPYHRVVPMNYGSEIESYRFDQGPTVVDVLWRREHGTSQVRGPEASFIRATSVDGSTIPAQFVANEWVVDVGLSPIFIERRP